MFIEERLLDLIAYGFTGGPTYATTRVQLTSGLVARNAERSRPLHRYSANYDKIREQDRQQVIDAYNACLGPVYGFRFKDWADYLLINEFQTTATGIEETIQLIKSYTFGPPGGEVTTVRTIRKPVDGMIILEDSVEIPSVIDLTTGEATFTGTLDGVITAVGQFDVPVMFDDDDLMFSIENWNANSADLTLLEDFQA
jgi:uncharacterized protein (TIGR02217 family)